MLISQGSFRVCKNHNVLLLILLTLLDKLATLLNLLKKIKLLLNISPGLEPRCAMCTLRLWYILYYTNKNLHVQHCPAAIKVSAPRLEAF